MQCLVDGGLIIEGEASIDLCGNLARNNLKDFLPELDKQSIQRGVDLLL